MVRTLARLNLAVAIVALGGCTPDTPPVSPGSTVASRTILDETALRSVEVAYMAARTAVELAVDLGRVKGERATRFRELNLRAYNGVLAARAAYRAGNAPTYKAKAAETLSLVDQLLALAKGN